MKCLTECIAWMPAAVEGLLSMEQ
uniref:Uncharacterized protein n=1 Tax=Arundo donax TaxID=35708 RepID=A0A0A9BA94_ARUDO